ncbi:tail fiber protein [Xenorhabdus innexi]|uniref:Tail protein n=1 Tax=Xenorhabdus innexi TaxID=290109 RepID=A0A1N6N0T3_9GAMM|nr:tail fiber protein [Xenorhabdus innexi]PHM30252.1 tail protein [Xenorhabdus innexi]SIP74711.1 conserved hypothetical protein [Xenorhabdus innexi]
MQDKKPDAPVSENSNLVTVTTPEYVKDSIKTAIVQHAASHNHPYATHVEPGFVTLSNETDSDSELTAATSKAVKKAYDLANTANQNALNSNSDLYLEKAKNGADIPDKAAFVSNLGLDETVSQAQNAYPKTGGTIQGEVTANRYWTKTSLNLGTGDWGKKHGILNSGKDSAGFEGNNVELFSWNGIGMRSTLNDETNIYFNPRNGEIGTRGVINAKQLITPSVIVGGGGFNAGSADNASFEGNNVEIRSWFGVGFKPTFGNPHELATVFINTRTGDISARGIIRAGNGEVLSLGQNCHQDGNGYIRPSFSVIEIHPSGNFTTNAESEGAIVQRLSEGIYLIQNVIGLGTDGTMNNIDIPLCQNKLPLIWINHEVLPDGSIKLMIYHREHSDAPVFARNTREGYSDGDLIDIPEGRFVSIRVQMPSSKSE